MPAGGIAVEGLRKRFGAVVALDGVSLEVARGELVGLLGPNGAGKSTLLRILGTTVLADGGSATVAGHDVEADATATRSSLGLVLGDERSWYWRLTGRHNLAFFAILHGLSRAAAAARAAVLLEEFGLGDAADRPFSGYSAGMRARLSLARALIAEPPVLLLDEPTRSLDPVGAARFRETVTRLAAERETSVLFVTHDLHEAAELATRVVVLVGGRVAGERPRGTSPAELERTLLAAI